MRISAAKIIFLTVCLNLTLSAQGYVCAVGGGSENYNSWSDAPYGWIVQKADSGKIIILGVSTATNWLPDYFMSLGADTAYNKTISTLVNADLQETYDELITAKAIFIRGGDQWNYIRLWKGTKTEEAINYLFQNGGVIAGTSAGEAVLGDVDFSARNGTVYPDESLLDPFNRYMQFEDNFLNLVPDVLFDSHFIERARHGRLIAMLYNRYSITGKSLIGVGVDDATAFCISPDGIGEVMGSGAVSIFTIDDETVFEPFVSNNYTIERLKSDQLTAGWKYDLNKKEISFIPVSAKDVDIQREWEFLQTNFWLTGSDSISFHLQTSFVNFISSVNTEKIVIITHPGYFAKLNPITNFLDQSSADYEIIYLNNSILNDPITLQKISDATNFVFAADSLNILSLLRDTTTLAGSLFKQKISIDKIPVFFFGKSGKIAGGFYTDNLYVDPYASYRGKMTNNEGLNLFGDFLFEPMLFDNSDFYENRMSSVLWGMMRNRKRFGVYLHDDALAVLNSADKMIISSGKIPPIYVDAFQTTKVDSSTFRASSSVGPRQVVAMNNLRYSITTSDDRGYLIDQGKFVGAVSVESEFNPILKDFILYQNYPNPFNPKTKIKFVIPSVGTRLALSVLKVYNILSQEVATLLDEYKHSGNYEIEFDASHLPSGIYFYRLSVGTYSQTKSMILLK